MNLVIIVINDFLTFLTTAVRIYVWVEISKCSLLKMYQLSLCVTIQITF